MDTMSSADENQNRMVPSFLPPGNVIGWNLTESVNPITKKKEFTYTVSVQTVGAFGSTETAEGVMTKCDGPCGNRVLSANLIQMGKCDHFLCKACFGIVKNPDGSYGCSNFDCWSEPQANFRKEKANYTKVINKQKSRARKFKKDGEDMKSCTKYDLPKTPVVDSDSERNSKKSSDSDKSSTCSFTKTAELSDS
ncbi:hypothetical protein CRE_29511 [Caenorhabditis remanei]|uniref:Uncharacterized protein n=1 Tax=Caenorhabditis remanei TaxID=31234 RepID=E3LVF2_CAERE|nr:hypothetical protein CRE_29511 [Caenorhabditis remanei]